MTSLATEQHSLGTGLLRALSPSLVAARRSLFWSGHLRRLVSGEMSAERSPTLQ